MKMKKTTYYWCMAFLFLVSGCSTTRTPATGTISDSSSRKITPRERAYLSCLKYIDKDIFDPFMIVESTRKCMREREYTLKGPVLSSEYTGSDGCLLDTDGDGVPDYLDQCPGTPKGVRVDDRGCPLDTDGDGVPDYLDKCPGTPLGIDVDEYGCPLDTDGDGVPDYLDQCPGTPKGVRVDDRGCPLDTDGDGVPDYLDKCPDTPRGVKVNELGCPIDTDGDGVFDDRDQCPDTPKGAWVDERGCWVIPDPLFDFDKYEIKPQYYSVLDRVVAILKRNPSLKVEIQGHTCNMGTAEYNMALSENRAGAILDYLVKKGIDKNRLTAVGYGLTRPKVSNETEADRRLNRRVELKPIR